ncbi:hypothetical protein [Lutibacter sp.]|uniref:hypothetical protein n=1 Tax=Lutibacter sp. TaxID=1925666 RepID=UPI00273444B9|nr:hypothetical protein [Lutibacter sp.]MDP3312403.1 hypothetical protein [Lutibacter sp.]
MKHLFKYFLIISLGLFMNSCYYDAIQDEVIIDNGNGGGTTEVSYATDIVPLWSQCTGCHGSIKPTLNINSYTNLLNGYVIAGDANNSVLYKSLLGTGGISLMPPGSKWPQSKIDLVKTWINQGAKNN